MVLKGDILVVSIFISDSYWNMFEKRIIFEELVKTEKFLISEASSYGKMINIKNLPLGIDYSLTIKNLEQFNLYNINRKIPFKEFLKIFFKNNFDDFYNKIIVGNNYDSFIILIFSNISGRSYAYNKLEKFNHAYICNNKNYLFLVNAHEILHLFGAIDLYRLPEEKKVIAKKKYSNDIMLNINANSNIDKLTAYDVGLNNQYEEIFYFIKN